MVLGIENRTENWKTAYRFAPYFRDSDARLRLVRRLGETDAVEGSSVHIELFWKGMRDHLHGIPKVEIEDSEARLLKYSGEMLPGIRKRILEWGEFRELKDYNYALPSSESKRKLLNNLYNTEIDIVIETPASLFIGEAKHEASFGADSRLVLVHQLIRQYVMAKSLLNTLGCRRRVVPFVVGDDVGRLKKRQQVRFMVAQGWMRGRNVLDWKDINASPQRDAVTQSGLSRILGRVA